MAVKAFLIRSAVGHEGPLDGSLWGLSEGKGPCDLEHMYTIVINTYNHTFGLLSINHICTHTYRQICF